MRSTVQSPGTRAASIALALAILVVPTLVDIRSAQAQTFKVLYAFSGGSDGGWSYGDLVPDAKGNLYGTTGYGGSAACPEGCGVVFKVDKTGKETVLYSFTGPPGDGANPLGGLGYAAGGNLYGTTAFGGTGGCQNGGNPSGCGTVFKVDKTGKETVLYNFTGTDGRVPLTGTVQDAQGSLYGITYAGGASNLGTVFKLDKSGKETVLHSFTGTGGDGAYPYAGLLQKGNLLYGTTEYGGSHGSGTVFMMDKTGKETVLYSFTGGTDGEYPEAGLVPPVDNLAGTTAGGGAYSFGTIFQLSKTGKYTVLYSFTGTGGDGSNPTGGLVRDPKGNLYGTTLNGGAYGSGTAFELDSAGRYTILRSFNPSTDGQNPYAVMIRDAKGNLYGTAIRLGPSGSGVVFKLTP